MTFSQLYLILNLGLFIYTMSFLIIKKLISIFCLVYLDRDSIYWDYMDSIYFLVECIFLNPVSLVASWYLLGIFSYEEIYQITDKVISSIASSSSQLPVEAFDSASASASLNSGVSPDFNNPMIDEETIKDEEEQSKEKLLKGPQYNASTYIMLGLTGFTLSVLVLLFLEKLM